jgi:hypothetical protein
MRTTLPITFRIPRDAVRALEKVRANETRTRSMQVLHYVLQGLIRDGFEMSQLDPRKADHE